MKLACDGTVAIDEIEAVEADDDDDELLTVECKLIGSRTSRTPGLHKGGHALLAVYAKHSINLADAGFAARADDSSAGSIEVAVPSRPGRKAAGKKAAVVRKQGGIEFRLYTWDTFNKEWVSSDAKVAVSSAVSAVSSVGRGPDEGLIVVTALRSSRRADDLAVNPALCVETRHVLDPPGRLHRIVCNARAAGLVNETLRAFEECEWDSTWDAVRDAEALRAQLLTLSRRDICADLAAAHDAAPCVGEGGGAGEPIEHRWRPFADLVDREANAGRKRARASLPPETRATTVVAEDWPVALRARDGKHPLPSPELVELLARDTDRDDDVVLCVTPSKYYAFGLFILDIIALKDYAGGLVEEWEDTSKFGIVHKTHVGIPAAILREDTTWPQNMRLVIAGPALAVPTGASGYKRHIDSKHFEATANLVPCTERIATLIAFAARMTSIPQYAAVMFEPIAMLGQEAHRDGSGENKSGRIGMSAQLNLGGPDFDSERNRQHTAARRDAGSASGGGGGGGGGAAVTLMDQVRCTRALRLPSHHCLLMLRESMCVRSLPTSRSTSARALIPTRAWPGATRSRLTCWHRSYTIRTRSCSPTASRWKVLFSQTLRRSRPRRRLAP